MTPNPYAPPGAEVSDPKHMQPAPPPSVRNACLLIGVALVLGMATLLLGVRVPSPEEQSVPRLLTFALVVLFGGLTVWFAFETFRGKNWARWAMLIYLALGWVLVASELNDQLVRAPLSAIINTVCIIMEFMACWLLFFGSGAQWFSQLAAQRKADLNEP